MDENSYIPGCGRSIVRIDDVVELDAILEREELVPEARERRLRECPEFLLSCMHELAPSKAPSWEAYQSLGGPSLPRSAFA